MTSFPFFLNTWEEYYTGELNLPIVNGIGEGTVCACIVIIMAGELGRDFFVQKIKIFEEFYMLNHLIVIVFFSTGVVFAIISLINVLREFRDKLSDAIQNLLFFLFLVFTLFIVVLYGESSIIREHPKLINILYGFSFAKLVGHLQLAHLSNAQFLQYRKSLFTTVAALGVTPILKTYYNIQIIDIDTLIILILIIHIVGNFLNNLFSLDAFCLLCNRRIM